MKKLNSKLAGVKNVLSKDQMSKIFGGVMFNNEPSMCGDSCYWDGDGNCNGRGGHGNNCLLCYNENETGVCLTSIG